MALISSSGAGGEIGDSAVFDFALLPEGLAEQDAVIGLAVDRDFGSVEIHSEHNIEILSLEYKQKRSHILVAT